MPLPALTPLRLAVTATLVPGFQYFLGRYRTSVLEYQCQVPS